ncbi:hypothetical protein RclHR1_13490002 [Rhizophagus clarus]|uniref:C2 domain-containing protein n=1 Tax=Rhizophagus clarus TaxID=94130 RepID=A0A2Z6QA38_9GLOM|nr:hypothetical protein RclHR1_13490002 [Rhizophagus clarus]
MYSKNDDFIESKKPIIYGFPEDYFYLKVSPLSQDYVLDVKRSSIFFGFGGTSVKEGSRPVIASKKKMIKIMMIPINFGDTKMAILIQVNLILILRKVGNCISLNHRKSGTHGANQRWTLTKEGYIALESHPKYVIDVKGGNVKDRSRVVLSDSGTKSFTQSNFAKWEIVSSNKKHHNESAIGIIRLELVEAEGLRCVDSFLAGGLSDPYVRVFHEGGQDIIAQTRVIDNTLNPVWDEVCCIPVKNIDDKFILEVMDFNLFTKHKPLGHCTFEVTKELIKEVSPIYMKEYRMALIGKWDNLSIEGKLHYRAKFIPLNLDILPKPTSDFLANLKEKPFDKLTLYFLVTLRAQNGNFPPSNTIATFFGYFDIERLFNLYKNHVQDERIINNTRLLRYLFKENREWTSIYGCSEQYISRELGGDLEIEEVVIDSGRKTVREIFKIKTVNGNCSYVPTVPSTEAPEKETAKFTATTEDIPTDSVSQAVTTTNDDHEVVDIEDS